MDITSRIHCDILQNPGPFNSPQLGLLLADIRKLVSAQDLEAVSGES